MLSALAISAVTANAATVVYGPTSFGTYPTGSSGTFPVPQFDPSLGTLLSVELNVLGSADGGSNGIENLSTVNAGSGTAAIGTNITVSGPSALTVLTTPATTGGSVLGIFDGTMDFGGTSGFTITGAPATDSDTTTLLSGFAPYIGLGNVTFNYTSANNTFTITDVSPAVTSSTPGVFGFTPTVTYTYDPIPESSSAVLGGLGLLALLRRRRR